MNVSVLDTETTDIEPGDVVEIAVVNTTTKTYWSSLVKPSCPIEFGAMATHHITEEMLTYNHSRADVLDWGARYHGGIGNVVVAHNAAFDRKFLPELTDRTWLCTWRCSLHLWPEAPGHSNQILRYWLRIDMNDLPAEAGQAAHRALYDAWTTSKILDRMLKEKTIEELIVLTTAPVLLQKCRFGKHAGVAWEDVPRDYMRWILRQADFDADVQHTCRHWLTR